MHQGWQKDNGQEVTKMDYLVAERSVSLIDIFNEWMQ